ncbi:MAG: DUF2493 domain-containing protein [Clostridiales bacterium]|nr:DUF2493 domain-containing protein [Clostridiales bacterium]
MSRYCIAKDGPALYPECTECEDKECEAFFCLVAGSRTFRDYDLMRRSLDYLLSLQQKVVIVSGGARGADTLAEQYAKERGYDLRVFPAKWNEYGKIAGMIRNEEMQQYIAKSNNRGIVAFWDGKSRGTAQNFELAQKYKNPVRLIRF